MVARKYKTKLIVEVCADTLLLEHGLRRQQGSAQAGDIAELEMLVARAGSAERRRTTKSNAERVAVRIAQRPCLRAVPGEIVAGAMMLWTL
eukprot:2728909-Pleurochrysis_carterae.AAC.1